MLQSFGISENFLLQRVFSRFSVDFFCLTVSNTIVGEPSSAVLHKTSDTEKVYG